MSTCENCIHFDICNEQADGNIVELMGKPCFRFAVKGELHAVEIILCPDCKHVYDGWDDFCCRLHKGLAKITHTSFCSYGERRADE